jgi:hypothetical protein
VATFADTNAFTVTINSGVSTPVTVQDIDSSQTIGAITLVQAHQLTPNKVTSAQTIDNTTAKPNYTVTAADIDSTHSIDNVILSQAGLIGINPITQAQSIDNVGLVQQGLLVLDKVSQAQGISVVDLLQHHVVAVEDLTQANLLSVIDLTEKAQLAVHGLDQVQVLNGTDLVNILFTVVVDDLDQNQIARNIEVVPSGILIPEKSLQFQSIGNITLTQSNTLTIQDLLQSQDIDPVVFGGLVVGSLDGDVVVYALLKADPIIYH